MATITYPTGRDYGAPQILEITFEAFSTTGDFMEDLELTAVTFKDAARSISGTVNVFRMDADQYRIGAAVLAEYDAGRYQPL
jgi:hypothetical protein